MKKKPQKDNFLYDDIFPPIIEKQINLEPNERSAFQLLEHFSYMNKKAMGKKAMGGESPSFIRILLLNKVDTKEILF